MKTGQKDTIVAIATPPGQGAVGVVRISGGKAGRLIESVWQPLKRDAKRKLEPRQLTLGWAMSKGKKIDQALAVFMPAPHSYTGEDVAELQTHGGEAVTQAVLSACLESGARLAEPGEFTKRAFINGKIDLVQAEAVLDLVQSENEALTRLATDQLAGGLSGAIKNIRESLILLSAQISAHLDFSEEYLVVDDESQIKATLTEIANQLGRLLQYENQVATLRQGFKVALVGLPNAGKSTLLNHLLGYERSIVTNIPGTTRDSIEEKLSIDDVTIRLVDTAGLNNAPDQVEQLGIGRTKEQISSSDLVLLLVEPGDESATTSYLEKNKLLNKEGNVSQPIVIVWTKSDLGRSPRPTKLKVKANDQVTIAALKDKGLSDIRRVLSEMARRHGGKESTAAITQRQIATIREARGLLTVARQAIEAGQPSDVILVDINEAIRVLGGLLGESTNQETIDAIFANFCIGK